MKEIKNLKKAAQRIIKAIKNKEKIILYGDADLDGVTSVIILKETLKNLGGEASAVYFPDREKEGYGLNEEALNFLKKFAPSLLIVFDCGIGNFREMRLANQLGFEVIIIDHHEVLDRLPKAKIIVDPKQKGDKYQFKGLATAGIAYKLSQLFFKRGLPDSLKKSFLELVALATLADLMPVESDNRIFIEEGLSEIENSWRPGLKAFFEKRVIKNQSPLRQKVQKIITALNTAENENHLNQTFLLLTTSSLETAKNMAEELLEKSYQKQARIREITEEVEEKIFQKLTNPLIFEGDSSWKISLLGPVASKICHHHQKPTFLFKRGEKESVGAVRTPGSLNGVKAMKSCSELLETYGGHPLAAGFTVKNENLEKFKECLIEYFKNPPN